MILNPYDFVPLTAHIKLEIYFPSVLEGNCIQEVSLMALNDTFNMQEISLDTKDLSYDMKAKELEVYWENECKQQSTDKQSIFCD